jgi:hypothetical protein
MDPNVAGLGQEWRTADHLAKLEAVVEAARGLTQCPDHASACCSEWCSRCQDEVATREALVSALSRLDGMVEK